MSVFLDWFLDPVNNERLRSPKSSSSGGVHNKVADLHAEIVEYVKERSGTTWEISQVKTKIKYAREKYNRARNLIRKASTQGNIDEQTLRDMVLNMCPDYDRFHELYAVQEEGKQRNNVESDDDSGDSDEDEDNAVDNEKEKEKEKEQEIAPRLIEEQTTIRTHVQPSAKRLKESRYEAEDPKIESVLQKIINMVDSDQSNLSDLQESRKDLRRREQAMDERERAWMERWIQRENEHHILLSERRQAVEKELMERKQLVEKELAEMKAELKQERAEFKQEVSEFKQERAEFKKEVDEERERVQQIREELAAARIELELRTVSCKDK
ncbi:hypothetical protein BGZ46_001325 [Entomortierella lignicola]|nr:hypothetical protein BGZ46_001325 [Entomortierella lignicola]